MSFSPEVSQRINDLAAKNGGRITPDIVVADAKKKTSPLHGLFEWDVDRAAMQHWIERARDIIRSVRVEVTVESKKVTAVAYVRDPKCGSSEQGYQHIERVAESPEDAAAVVAYELSRAESAMARVVDIGKALGLEAQAREALAKIVGIRKRVDKRRGVHRSVAASV